jgi:hypothetical protein
VKLGGLKDVELTGRQASTNGRAPAKRTINMQGTKAYIDAYCGSRNHLRGGLGPFLRYEVGGAW